MVVEGSIKIWPEVSHPDVDVLLGGGFEELEAERVRQLLSALEGNDPLVLLGLKKQHSIKSQRSAVVFPPGTPVFTLLLSR